MPTFSSTISRVVTRRTFDTLFAPVTAALGGSWGSFTLSAGRNYNTTSFTIYSGVQPTAELVESNWASYNQSAASCLAHYSSGVTWSYNINTMTYYFTNTSNSITTNALRSGTAAWAIIWNATNVDIDSETVPASSRFIVAPVTDINGIGIIRYTSLTTTSGQAFIPYDGGLSISES
jgi:hypothetical protein